MASALEDYVTKYVAGRQDSGGTLTITVNLTDSTVTEWEAVITAGADSTVALYWEIYFPNLTKAFVIKAYPPTEMPSPEVEQNGLLTVEITLVIEEYVGLETAVAPTP